ncbi:MAG TPA: efflux RND transporter periplasmic adaptor subunit [Candidatus Acidoferrales bacterium]|jgi:membrane fusion protein (multidrug efflux system)|nr:efflux RND transporter periplasmic adaptor subunit [Candidatus Acidoferrales bacterium]
MPQRTEVETPTTQPEETSSATETHSETHSASPPPEYHRRGFFQANPRARLYLVLAAIVLIVGGIFAWRYFSSYESTDDAEVDGHLMPLSARISGYVSVVNVDDNQDVHKGDVLVEIDPRDYQTALDQAKANLASAQATARSLNINIPVTSVSTTSQVSSSQADIDNAQAGIVAARQQYDASQADLVQAQANNQKAQNDLVRYKQLVDKQEISQQLYDQAVAAAAAGNATVAAAKANVSASEQQITQARARLAQAEAGYRSSQTGPQQVASTRARALSAEADVQEKQAALEQAELNLQYTKIRAPVDGVVSKSVEVGMNVQPGQQLLTIVPLNDVWVTADFKETQLKYMRPGQAAEIKVDANGRTYKGHVDSIAGSSGARLSLLPPENATGNYVKVVQRVPVKIVLNPGQNSDDYLRLGMSVEPKVFVK